MKKNLILDFLVLTGLVACLTELVVKKILSQVKLLLILQHQFMFNLILILMKTLTAEASTQVTTSTKVINGGNLIKADKPKTASYKRVVIGSNSILKEQCFKLGYARDILLNNEESILTAQKKNKEFNELDLSRLLDIFNILEDSKRNSKLYKAIEGLKSIKTKSGKFVPFNILRAVNTNMAHLKPMLTPIK